MEVELGDPGMRLEIFSRRLSAYALTVLLGLLLTFTSSFAEESNFETTWKLLKPKEKQQFIAGYQAGWKDFDAVLEIVAQYVKDNPDQAVKSLEKLRKLYSLQGLRPDQLADGIDRFYSEGDNRDKGLAQALGAARSQH